jgi:hypothetical protein
VGRSVAGPEVVEKKRKKELENGLGRWVEKGFWAGIGK